MIIETSAMDLPMPPAVTLPPIEDIVWQRLQKRRLAGLRFERRRMIGSHRVDFFCENTHLAIDLDGDSRGIESDLGKERRKCLAAHGVDLLRFTCRDAYEDIEGICATIIRRSHGRGCANERTVA